MKSGEIREQFIDYFRKLGHRFVPSAPLVPADDPTLLFTNAGMNQFKDVFLGTGAREYTRAVNSQKCMRVSGKHNDLEDVGVDTYHHTFFEMLGNWSFGDYYKREAIEWAWNLFTRDWKIAPERLWATVFVKDDESARIWPEATGIGPERVLRFDESENFWEMAETGPCGPCSEIHIDMGERHCRMRGQPGHSCAINCGCGRYIEIWNLVFIQYHKNELGELVELPQKHVDTGMGFERLVAVLQGVDSNYATDLFTPIIAAVEDAAHRKYAPESKDAAAFRVIADHARALSFAIADGALPSNEGRGYVLRMILRRAVRYGHTLGIEEPFLYRIVPVVASVMQEAYPELRQHMEHVSRVMLSEEERFLNTLTFGLELLSEIIRKAKSDGSTVISGEDVFRLYDTYGFPVDLTGLVAREEGLSIDGSGFERLMGEQKERARAAWKAAPEGAGAEVYRELLRKTGKSAFLGYEELAADAEVRVLLRGEKEVDALREGEEGGVILDRTPCYAEAGGQVGDAGRIYTDTATALITDTRSLIEGLVVHRVKMLKGELGRGARVRVEADGDRRLETARSHTATHLLQNALRQVLGEHVKQAGSLVAPGRLRFDFTHFTGMSPREIERVEDLINQKIRENAPVRAYEIPYDEARKKDIIAIFGEKYGERVRVVDIGGYSRELCGGTHVRAAGEIGLCKILGEASIAAGMRRIEALTGEAAFRFLRKRDGQVRDLARLLRAEPEAVLDKVEILKKEHKSLKKEAGRKKEGETLGDPKRIVKEAGRRAGEILVVAHKLPELGMDALRNAGDRVKESLPDASGVVVLGSSLQGRTHIVCMVTDDLVKKGIDAGAIVKEIAGIIGGRGGGRAAMAQAGGLRADKLDEALGKVPEVIMRLRS